MLNKTEVFVEEAYDRAMDGEILPFKSKHIHEVDPLTLTIDDIIDMQDETEVVP